MIILGIETSCDETAAAVCHDGEIVSSFVTSQAIHSLYGGVVPEIASREHDKWLAIAVSNALEKVNLEINEIDAVAVTRGPGLMGALLTGVSFAKGLADGLDIPCLGINHIEAHIYANFIAYPELKYPFLCLLVSGGHTQIWRVDGLGQYKLLGETRDDAAGEAFDKGARILQLGYPGGPAIEKAATNGNAFAFDFPMSFLMSKNIEFSFSGLKTSLLNFVENTGREYVYKKIPDIAASYQYAINHILIAKLQQSMELTEINTTVIAGGVAANRELRRLSGEMLRDCTVLFPSTDLCTDNAAMVAFLGEKYMKRGIGNCQNLKVVPNLSLSV